MAASDGWRQRMVAVGLPWRFLETVGWKPSEVAEIDLAQLPAHVAANTPALLRSHTTDWPPTRWSASTVGEACGDRTVPVRLMDGETGLPLASRDTGQKYAVEKLPIVEAMAELERVASVGGHARWYLAQLQLRHELPELAHEARPPPEALSCLGLLSRTSPAAYFGVGNCTPLHFDVPENLLCVVRGRKDVRLWHPALGDALVGDGRDKSIVVEAPWTTLYSGDVLYIPSCWWHEVSCPPSELSISISYWADSPHGKMEARNLEEEIESSGDSASIGRAAQLNDAVTSGSGGQESRDGTETAMRWELEALMTSDKATTK